MVEKISQDWAVKVSSKAEKYILKLARPVRERVIEELKALSKYEDPLQHPDTRSLTGPLKGMHRLRIAGYRVIFELIKDKEKRIIAVVTVAPRGDVYKK